VLERLCNTENGRGKRGSRRCDIAPEISNRGNPIECKDSNILHVVYDWKHLTDYSDNYVIEVLFN
jgi:hypothetical protein